MCNNCRRSRGAGNDHLYMICHVAGCNAQYCLECFACMENKCGRCNGEIEKLESEDEISDCGDDTGMMPYF